MGKRKLTDDWGFKSRFILDGPILIDHHLSKPTLFRNILKCKIELYKKFLPVCNSEVGNYKYHLFHCLICVQSTIKLNRNMMMKQKIGKRSRKDDHTWIYTAWMGSFGTLYWLVLLHYCIALNCREFQSSIIKQYIWHIYHHVSSVSTLFGGASPSLMMAFSNLWRRGTQAAVLNHVWFK